MMTIRAAMGALGAGLLAWAVVAPGAPGSAPGPDAAAEPAFTAQQQQAFDDLYKPRIDQASSRDQKAALAKELLGGAGTAEGGLKYLLLGAAKDLAVAAGDLELAVQAGEKLAEMKRGDRKALLADLLDLQIKHFYLLGRKPVSPAEKPAMQKVLHALAGRIADSALELAALHRQQADFDASDGALKLALRPAMLVSSPRLPEVRQGIEVSRALGELAALARRCVNLNQLAQAQWAYLDAGLYAEAFKLQPDQRDETAELLLRAATAADVAPAELFAAAKAWDQRAVEAKGPLQQLRLARAGELYQRFITGAAESPDRNLAKARLQAIEQQIGDLADSLRPPTEWVNLVDLKEESASVGWGSFEKITVGRGPIGIAGKWFATGLKVHASSKVTYSLRGRYKQLAIHYGLLSGAGGVASFHIVCDGREVFNSEWMWSNHTKGVNQPAVISLAGVDKLELITTAHRGGQGAFSAWGEPKVR